MELGTFLRLLDHEGQTAITVAEELKPSDVRYPACYDRLTKHFPSDVSRAALDTVMLRARAAAKFAHASRMYFTREALEMATHETVSRYRADRFRRFGTVADVGCGIGGDLIGLGMAGVGTSAVDRDPLRLRMAEANTAAYGLTGRFALADVLSEPLPDTDAVFADPGRRPGGRRTLSVSEYEPPVDRLISLRPAGFPAGVKVAPGVSRSDIQRFDAEAEFISLDGEMKECTLWFGPLKTNMLRATVLPGGHTLTADTIPLPTEVRAPQRYIYDPDPSVTRSSLVPTLAVKIGATQIDSEIGFLTSDNPVSTPFATAYRVEDTLPFHAKRIGQWLRGNRIGRVTVVKRGSPVVVDDLLSRWKLTGDEHRTILLTRTQGKPVAIIAERLS
jgi:hypothetical protein